VIQGHKTQMFHSSRSCEGGCLGRCASPSPARTAHGPDHMPLAHSARHPELPHLVSAKHTHVDEDPTCTLIFVLLDYHLSSMNSTLAHHAEPCVQNKEDGLDTLRQRKHCIPSKSKLCLHHLWATPNTMILRIPSIRITKPLHAHQSLENALIEAAPILRLGVWLGSWPIRRCK